MSLRAGEKLGPYEILAPIGAGGMGEVCKARDTRLNRVVAIKTSKAQFNERFARETRAIGFDIPPGVALGQPTPDGQRYLAGIAEGGSATPDLFNVVLNWQAGLKN